MSEEAVEGLRDSKKEQSRATFGAEVELLTTAAWISNLLFTTTVVYNTLACSTNGVNTLAGTFSGVTTSACNINGVRLRFRLAPRHGRKCDDRELVLPSNCSGLDRSLHVPLDWHLWLAGARSCTSLLEAL
jgi:hypothetical protein